MTALIVLAIGAIALFIVTLYIREEVRSSYTDRRNWPERLRQDYEVERIRDHLFDRLRPSDIEWLITHGWTPPAEVARTWNEMARYRRLSTMSPTEMDAYLKARAAGVHVSAHPDDLIFVAEG